jgi:hypothetical protein
MWVPWLVVGMEYEIQGKTGARKLILDCKITMMMLKYSF